MTNDLHKASRYVMRMRCASLIKQGGRRQDKRACERVSLSLAGEAGRTGGCGCGGAVAHTPATGGGEGRGASRVTGVK